MSKTLIEMHELRRLALADIHEQGYQGVDISIDHVANAEAPSNWSIVPVCFGNCDPNAVKRAVIYVRSKLARDYDLLTDA
ncbi:hypothetical protein AC629_41370 [Bradyrhizobium sp. NAS80.1]|uniref:hypothetical protein n=1 Tax=Bradyrhizobium sp. NAS80.1 TaxID=1680159 RepID=UPI000966766F|nr:hypothetical protein [Bradyrhizobium sp. NAS80.1]OKO69318.1 hypothetical protein AC629_41370 [Bradyrhizobium sp. NAS80.1]